MDFHNYRDGLELQPSKVTGVETEEGKGWFSLHAPSLRPGPEGLALVSSANVALNGPTVPKVLGRVPQCPPRTVRSGAVWWRELN